MTAKIFAIVLFPIIAIGYLSRWAVEAFWYGMEIAEDHIKYVFS